jgi:phosphinothricin acetyltransferase
MIRHATAADVPAICEIYNHHVLHTVVTFEEEPVSPAEMQQRLDTITARYPWLVFEDKGAVAGYAYASQWKTRAAYRHSVETSIYVGQGYIGLGIGRRLYTRLLELLKAQGIHAAIGGASLPNEASVKLHESLGFKYVGTFTEVGHKFGKWIDTGYWELQL